MLRIHRGGRNSDEKRRRDPHGRSQHPVRLQPLFPRRTPSQVDPEATASARAEATVLSTVIQAIAATIDASGADSMKVALQAGVPPAAFGSEPIRVPATIADRYMALAVEATGDEGFGVRIARRVDQMTYHLFYAFSAANSVADCMALFARFRRMVGDEMECSLRMTERGAEWSFECPETCWQIGDCLAASALLMCRSVLKQPTLMPRSVALRRPQPGDDSGFREVFGSAIRYGASRNLLVFDPGVPCLPVPTANPEVAAHIEALVRDYLERLDEASLAERVRRVIAYRLPAGEVTRTVVARELGLSTRTLLRRLAEEGCCFRELQEEVRRDLALRYLRAGNSSLSEIALVLGFSDASVLSRALRRWTGMTALQYADTCPPLEQRSA